VRYAEIKVALSRQVECRLCGEHFGAISYHLRRVHGCSVTEYRQDYPGAQVMDEYRCASIMKHGNTGRGRVKHLLLPHWEPVWSPEYVLDRINEFHRRGFDVNYKAIYRRDTVASHAPAHFGSWMPP